MWLSTPKTMTNRWEGRMEPELVEGERGGESLRMRAMSLRARGEEPARDGIEASIAVVAEELPVVSIGQPEVWALTDLYAPEKMPQALRAKIDEAAFYFVRLSCSFRPVRDRYLIDSARFEVRLQPDGTGQQAIAFDVHPLLVTQEVKRDVKVSLSPTVKFQEVEAGLGTVDFGFEYTALEPVISASGAGESRPSWDFTSAKGVHVQGSKWMHLLVKAPRAMTTGVAALSLRADVVKDGFRWPLITRPSKKDADPLSVQLWP